MKVIDARSGRELKIGDRVDYPDGEYVKLLDYDPGIFMASAWIELGLIDHAQDELVLDYLAPVVALTKKGVPLVEAAQQYRVIKHGPIVAIKREVPLTVRWFHPAFLFQHVALLNT